MHPAFSDVLWIVLGVGVLASIWAMATASKEWESYSRSGLDMDSVRAVHHAPVNAAVAAAERDSEIRQMVEAANARRVRRGEAERDVDAEVARLSAAAAQAPPSLTATRRDPELEGEIRALVELRNQRRVRKGQEPLDIDAEIRREFAALSALHPGVSSHH